MIKISETDKTFNEKNHKHCVNVKKTEKLQLIGSNFVQLPKAISPSNAEGVGLEVRRKTSSLGFTKRTVNDGQKQLPMPFIVQDTKQNKDWLSSHLDTFREMRLPKASPDGLQQKDSLGFLGESVLGVTGAKPSVLSYIEQVAAYSRQNSSKRRIKNCSKNPISLALIKKKGATKVTVVNLFCGSWRCPTCAPRVQHRDYFRIKEALDKNTGRWLFIVLTFDPKKYDGKESAYKLISKNTNKLLKRINRKYGKILYIQSIEQHKNGYPHVNMLLKFDDEFILSDEDCEKFRSSYLVKASLKSGFGKIVSCSIAKGDGNAVANYIAKTGLSIVGEVSKISQVPIESPIGTRRIRSSKGLLKPVKNIDSEYTGRIIYSSLASIEKASPELIIDTLSRDFSKEEFCAVTEVEFGKPDNKGVLFFEDIEHDVRIMEMKDPVLISITA